MIGKNSLSRSILNKVSDGVIIYRENSSTSLMLEKIMRAKELRREARIFQKSIQLRVYANNIDIVGLKHPGVSSDFPDWGQDKIYLIIKQEIGAFSSLLLCCNWNGYSLVIPIKSLYSFTRGGTTYSTLKCENLIDVVSANISRGREEPLNG